MNFKPHELDTMRYALEDLKDNLEAIGPCDHSVDICVCGHRAVLLDLTTLFHRITDGQVGYKQQATPTCDFVDMAHKLLLQSNLDRIAQIKAEADAANAQFKKGTING